MPGDGESVPRELDAEVLRESEALLRFALHAARMVAWDLNLATGQMWRSETAAELFGLRSGDPTDFFYALVHPEDRERVRTAFEEAKQGEVPYVEEFRIVTADGRTLWIAGKGTLRTDPNTGARHLTGVSRDITPRKSAEQALKQNEERFRVLVEAAAQAVWETDAAGAAIGDSPSWRAYTGQPLEEALGFGWLNVIHPDEREWAARQWREAVATGRNVNGEYRFRTAEGEWRWSNVRAAPIRNASGTIVKWVGMNSDITERKHAEEALREADRRKDEFLATLAHELRNPLAPIRNAVQIMNLRAPPDPALQSARDMIERQVVQMIRLIDDLLDMSRVTTGKLTLRKERLLLSGIVQDALDTARPHVGHRLTVALPSEPLSVHGDPVRLTQILVNLLHNACKYTEKGGAIRLTAERDGAQVAVRVKDSGIGIAPEHLPRLFEMFSQVEPARQSAKGGLGIGLALARRLVEKHGGAIAAHSEGIGKGSEFIVRLPVAEAPLAASPGARTKDAGALAGQRVLVVDDMEDAAESLATLLRLSGNEVQTAHDGRDALEKARNFRPGIALLDIGMPGMDGYDACRAIRSEPWGKDIIVIALTGWGQEEDRRKSEQAGFDGHLVKPVDQESLFNMITAARAMRRK